MHFTYICRIFISYCVCLFFCTFCALTSHASSPPIPQSKATALEEFQKRLEREKKEELELKSTVDNLKDEMSRTQDKLIALAAKIQENEKDIDSYTKRMANLELRKSILEDKLNEDKSSIAKLILALERVSRIPPEAMLARPQTPYKTAQSALVMGNIVPSLKKHSEKLNKNLETLQKVSDELEIDRIKLENTSKSLRAQHEELDRLVKKRRSTFETAQSDLNTKEIMIEKISLHAKDLEELVEKIEKEEKARSAQLTKSLLRKKPRIENTQKLLSSSSDNVQLPLSGIIRTGFHQQDTIGAESNGISIEGRPGALVVAPMDGKIKFTGNFKRYGKIVIIEHKDGYHSLVAGVGEISAVIDDFVKCGEPIGLLPNSSLIPRPTLYYEIRKNGLPVNPSEKFSDLG